MRKIIQDDKLDADTCYNLAKQNINDHQDEARYYVEQGVSKNPDDERLKGLKKVLQAKNSNSSANISSSSSFLSSSSSKTSQKKKDKKRN